MKKTFYFALAVAGIALVGCTGSPKTAPEGFTKVEVDSMSTALGQNLALMISDPKFQNLDINLIVKAFKDVYLKTDMDDEQKNEIYKQSTAVIEQYLTKQQLVIGEKNKAEAQKFLEENKTKEGVLTTESGLQYKIIKEGNEVRATATDTVEVHYEGKLLDGTVFDSSYERGEMVKFPLDRVIPGWTEGMQLIGEGAEVIFWIPSDLAYGERGSGPIGPNSTLEFKVELNKIFPAAK